MQELINELTPKLSAYIRSIGKKLDEGSGSFFRHAREGGHPGASNPVGKRTLDSRLRGNDGGLIRKLPDCSIR